MLDELSLGTYTSELSRIHISTVEDLVHAVDHAHEDLSRLGIKDHDMENIKHYIRSHSGDIEEHEKTSAASAVKNINELGSDGANEELPEGWAQHSYNGQVYYHNEDTGESSWGRPQQGLPKGWIRHVQNGQEFYHNEISGASSWVHPSDISNKEGNEYHSNSNILERGQSPSRSVHMEREEDEDEDE